MERKEKIAVNSILGAIMLCMTLMVGALFTSVRTNAIGSESFEAGPQVSVVESIDSFDDLVQR